MRKYLNYIVFGAVVLVVVGLAVNHSRHMRFLVNGLTSDDKQTQATAASELIAMEQFMDAITGEPVETRVKAAGALESLGNDAAVKQAIAFLKDPDKPVRDRLIVTLQHVGANSDKNVKELVNGLKDGDAYVRKGTIAALTDPHNGIGPKPGVIKAIVALMKPEAGARGPGGDVLGNALFLTDAARAESVPLLLAQLQDKDEGVRGGAAEALGKVGDARAIPALKDTMAKDTAQVRRRAIGAIALIADRSGEDSLTESIKNVNDDKEARAQAASGLGKISSPTAISTLIEALNDDDLALRTSAVAALARAGRPKSDGPANTPVLAELNRALRDHRPPVRLGAAQALQTIAAPDANTTLIALLQNDPGAPDDPDMRDNIRSAAALALGFPGNRPAVAPLIQALSDTSGDVVDAAQKALAAIGPAATDALIAVMQKGSTDALYASRALAAQGPSALPALQKAAQNPNPVGQRWAAVALGDMNVADARPTLQALEKSSDPDVAYVAKEKLDSLGRTP